MQPKQNRIRLLMSYDGTDFGGWQRQAKGTPTVQETLESALEKLLGSKINVMASGRTDAGVHAAGQVVHFESPKEITSPDLCHALNCLTPPSLVIRKAWVAPPEFHANRSAVKKTYKYRIINTARPSSLLYRYSWWYRRPLDVHLINQYCEFLVGKQDFKSFQSTGTDVKTSEREIFEASWKQRGSCLEFTITGSGFLKQMVRNIVGTVVELAQNQRPASEMELILGQLDRRAAGTTAPPQGLFLYRVYYPAELDKKCRKL